MVGTMKTKQSFHYSEASCTFNTETSTPPAQTSCCSARCPVFIGALCSQKGKLYHILPLEASLQVLEHVPTTPYKCQVVYMLTFYILELKGFNILTSSMHTKKVKAPASFSSHQRIQLEMNNILHLIIQTSH